MILAWYWVSSAPRAACRDKVGSRGEAGEKQGGASAGWGRGGVQQRRVGQGRSKAGVECREFAGRVQRGWLSAVLSCKPQDMEDDRLGYAPPCDI